MPAVKGRVSRDLTSFSFRLLAVLAYAKVGFNKKGILGKVLAFSGCLLKVNTKFESVLKWDLSRI